MSVSSRDQSFQLFSCRWAWCRSTFSNNAGLVRHVVHDHVLPAIPVRRRDISMIKRTEEGRGESLKISELMVDMYSYSSRELSSHKSVELPEEPSSSLPSPPASSPALHSPHHLAHLLGSGSSPSPLSLEQREKSISSHDISRQNSPPLPFPKILRGQNSPANQITTFASLSSPEPGQPPFSFEMPDSPSFSSLVERPNKRKRTSNSGSLSRNKTHVNQLHSLPLSQPSSASSASQNSVEAQLTQTQDDDDDDMNQAQNPLSYHSSNALLSQVPDIFIPSFGLIHEHDGLQWELSQPVEEYLSSGPISQSQSNGHRHLEDLPVMSQPPSQLRLDPEFPLHFHDRPQSSTSQIPPIVQTGLDPNAAVPLTLISPPSAASPIFAVSTPVRQNWYQPHFTRKKRSACKDKNSDSSLKREVSVSPTKPKKMFRSGTLQITPRPSSEEPKDKHTNADALTSGANRQNNLATRLHSPYDSCSQSSQDSSDSSEIHSYPPLQTQAPYQSQILSQF